MLIIPAILTNDIGQLTALESRAEGVVERVQIDVIDNKFAENSTVDPAVLKSIVTILALDFHLMVKDPIEWVDHCVAGAKNRIIGQVEYMQDQAEFVRKVKEAGSTVGLALDLATAVDKLNQDVLPNLDVVLLMSVPAGFGGQQFDMAVWNKIEKVVKLRKELNLNFKICIDGGVTKELINQMETLGVDEVSVGRRIFEPNLKENLEKFEDG